MRTRNLFIVPATGNAERVAALIRTLDSVADLYYRPIIATVPDTDTTGALRVTLTPAHAVLVILEDCIELAPTAAAVVALASTGFHRRIPIIGIVAPGSTGAGRPALDADQLVIWDGNLIAEAIGALDDARIASRLRRPAHQPAGATEPPA